MKTRYSLDSKARALLAGLLAATLAGCAPVLIGAGVVGGYAISKDTVQNYFERPQSQVFKAALSAVQTHGVVTLQDGVRGRIEGLVNECKVTVLIDPVTEGTVRLRVKARNKFFMPAIEQAQTIHNSIFATLNP